MYHFVWNGVSSHNKGLWVSTIAPPVKPAERVTQVRIPGLAGTLTLTQGDDIYDSYVRQVVVQCDREDADYHDLIAWLRGSGTIIFSNEPNRSQQARIINAVTFSKAGNSIAQANIDFLCHPYKAQLPGEDVIALTPNATTAITSVGDVASKPLITANMTGNSSITIAGQTIEIDVAHLAAENGSYSVVIDCESCMTRDAVADRLAEAANVNSVYPSIPLGNSTASASVAAVIVPRWRWL